MSRRRTVAEIKARYFRAWRGNLAHVMSPTSPTALGLPLGNTKP